MALKELHLRAEINQIIVQQIKEGKAKEGLSLDPENPNLALLTTKNRRAYSVYQFPTVMMQSFINQEEKENKNEISL